MSTIAIRASAVNGMSAIQRKVLKIVCESLDLGTPALYQTAALVQWYIFDDHRITLKDCAILGRFANMLASAPDVNTRAEVAAWVASSIVLPQNIDYTNSTNAWQTTLTANGAPATVQAASSVPATLTPVP